MRCRARVAALSLLLVACAPSIPHPGRAPDDAAVDLPAASDAASDARADSRAPPPPPVSDAAGDSPTASRDAAPRDAPPEAPRDAQQDAPQGGRDDGDVSAEAARDTRSYDGPPPVPPRAGEVVIDELLVNPAGTDTSREWIEIVNSTALALDLGQLHVADAASEVAVDAGVLLPGGILVLGQSLDPTRNGGAPVDVAFGNTISLNNGGDSITLCLGPCVDGQILDQVTWASDLGAGYDGHAAIVDPGSGDFCPADQPFGTAASFGSPGAPNPPCGG
jgi:Lamin Tail Domain